MQIPLQGTFLQSKTNTSKKRALAKSSGVKARLFAGFAVLNGAAHAQTPPSLSQIPPGERAGERTAPATLSLPAPQGLKAPDNADEINLVVGAFDIEGAFGGVALAPPQAGSSITVGDVYRYAALLQQAYFDAGYPLARVVVPAQELDTSGKVRVRVISGNVERIDVSNIPAHVRQRIADVLAPLVSKPHLRRDEIERRLLLAGDMAGVSLQSALSPGVLAGGTILVVSGEHNLIDGVISVDNSLVEELGRYQLTASAAINSAFGIGDRVVIALAGPGDDTLFEGDRPREYVGVSADIPIGIDGLVLSASGVYAKSNPAGILARQKLESEFSLASVSLSYPLVRKRTSTHRLTVSLDRAEERQLTGIVAPAATIYLDSTTVISASLAGQVRLEDGASAGYDVSLSRGIDAFGARSSADATPFKPLSRAGADNEFTKLEVSGQLAVPIGDFNLIPSGHFSTGFGDPLLTSQQSAIIGQNLVSGPPSGYLTGDDAVSARVEIERPLSTLMGTIVPYSYGAAGKIALRSPSALELADETATSIGVGLRALTSLSDHNAVVVGLEWALVEAERQELDRHWLGGSVALRF